MKYILITKSESGDMYHYGIETATPMDSKRAEEFLQEHSMDRDENMVYDYEEMLILLPNVEFIKY